MVRKKSNVFLGILIFLVVTALIIGGYFIFKSSTEQTVYGYTSLSISKVEIVGSGQYIRIYGVANGAEQININFNAGQINDNLKNTGYAVKNGVVGKIVMNEPTREFLINKNSDKNFFHINTFELSILRHCNNNLPSGTGIVGMGRIGTLGLCVYRIYDIGTYSPFTGVTIDSTPVNIDIGGATGTLNPSTGNNVLVLNDGKTKVEWVGNLVNVVGLNTPYQYATLFKNSQFSKLIDATTWNTEVNAWYVYQDCIGTSRTSIPGVSTIIDWALSLSDSKAKTCVLNYNNQINAILVDRQGAYVNSVNANSVAFTNNGVDVRLKTVTVFPTFIITLDASTVGIVELKGTPQIISCVANKDINSGDTYSTDVQVKNIGTSDGSFYGQISCVGASSASGILSEQYVEAGQTVSIPIMVSGMNIQSGTQSNKCTIKIIDRKSQQSAICDFNLGVKYQSNIVCDPNKITCQDSKTLKKCSADGLSFETTKCDNGCVVLESGEAQCVQQSKEVCIDELDNDGDGLVDLADPDCKTEKCKDWIFGIPNIPCLINNWFMKFRYVFSVVIGLLGGLLSVSYTNRFVDEEFIERNKWIYIIVFLVIGGALSYLSFIYFWFILIALIIMGIVRAFIPV